MKKKVLGISVAVVLAGCGSGSSGVVGELASSIASSLAQASPYKNWTLDHDVLAATWQALRVSVGNSAAQAVMREARTQTVGFSGNCVGGGSVSIAQDAEAAPHYHFNDCVPALVPGLKLTGDVESGGALRSKTPLLLGGQLLGNDSNIRATEGLLRGKTSGSNNLASNVQKARVQIGSRVLAVDDLSFDANFNPVEPGSFSTGGANGSFSVDNAHHLLITKTRIDWNAQGPQAGRIEVLVTRNGETIRHDFEFTGNGDIVSYHPATREPHRTSWSSAEMQAARARFAD